jgi:protein-disulfide isomerase
VLEEGNFAYLGAYTAYYYWQIKQGRGALLAAQFPKAQLGSFTKVSNGDRVANLLPVDRTALEEGNFAYLGARNPTITIVEFFDFKCPFCKETNPILQQLIGSYGNKVKLIVRNFPIESRHPGATELAELGVCAKDQGRFWPLYDYLYKQQDTIPESLTSEVVKDIAEKVSLDISKLQDCLSSPNTLQAVNKDYADAYALGVEGTPTFFINGEKFEGVIPFKVWDEYLKKL